MKDISLVRYDDNGFTPSLVECYRQVFADPPWNEWFECSICGKYWGNKDRALLENCNFKHCGVSMREFWPREQVETDLKHEITPNSSCWLALHKQTVVGFCWGYPIGLQALEEKLGIKLDVSLLGIDPDERVAYQDEVGVMSDFRHQKIAKTMVRNRLADFLSQSLRVGIVRTRQAPEPSETYLWYRKIGYLVLATYSGDDGRVILGRPLYGLSDLL